MSKKPAKPPKPAPLPKLSAAKITTFIPDAGNANRGTERGRGLLEKSLRDFGAGRSILADKNGRIVAGNHTHQVASEIGMKTVVVETDGNTLVVVKRNDVDLDTPEGRALALADNRVGETNLKWDPEALGQLVDAGVKVGDWFFDWELTGMLPSVESTPEKKSDEKGESKSPEPPTTLTFSVVLSNAEYHRVLETLERAKEHFGTEGTPETFMRIVEAFRP